MNIDLTAAPADLDPAAAAELAHVRKMELAAFMLDYDAIGFAEHLAQANNEHHREVLGIIMVGCVAWIQAEYDDTAAARRDTMSALLRMRKLAHEMQVDFGAALPYAASVASNFAAAARHLRSYGEHVWCPDEELLTATAGAFERWLSVRLDFSLMPLGLSLVEADPVGAVTVDNGPLGRFVHLVLDEADRAEATGGEAAVDVDRILAVVAEADAPAIEVAPDTSIDPRFADLDLTEAAPAAPSTSTDARFAGIELDDTPAPAAGPGFTGEASEPREDGLGADIGRAFDDAAAAR